MLLFLFAVMAYPSTLEIPLRKDIYIKISAFSDFCIGYSIYNASQPFQVMLELSRYKKAIKGYLEYDTGLYKISIGGEYLCEKDNQVITCDKTLQLWEIVPERYGYLIKTTGKCVTAAQQGIVLKDCIEPDRQVFLFQEVENKCLKLAGNLNYPPKTGKQQQIRDYLKKIGVIDDYGKVEDPKTFDDFVKNLMPELKDKPKVKNVLEKVFKKIKDNKNRNWPWPGWRNLFCPK